MGLRQKLSRGEIQDDERREQASLLALRLSQLMGLDESDDEAEQSD